jgi:hypothetical protein
VATPKQLREFRMKTAKVGYTIALCVLCAGVAVSFAQDPAKTPEGAAQPVPMLPKSFKGELIAVNQSFRQVALVVELQINSLSADGRVTGAYSRAVRTRSPETLCIYADNLPAEGTYDGENLVLKIKGSQNSHTCDDYTVTFVRGKEHYFERKIPTGSSYLDPVK